MSTLTLNPVSAKDTNLLFLLSKANFKGTKQEVRSSWLGLRKRLFWLQSKSKTGDNEALGT